MCFLALAGLGLSACATSPLSVSGYDKARAAIDQNDFPAFKVMFEGDSSKETEQFSCLLNHVAEAAHTDKKCRADFATFLVKRGAGFTEDKIATRYKGGTFDQVMDWNV